MGVYIEYDSMNFIAAWMGENPPDKAMKRRP